MSREALSQSQLELERAIKEMKSVGTFGLRINEGGVGGLTVEKRHQERLVHLNPTVKRYEGFLLKTKQEIDLFLSQFYNPRYTVYAFNPVLCTMEKCEEPMCEECLKVKDSEGRRPHLCVQHFEMAFGTSKKKAAFSF